MIETPLRIGGRAAGELGDVTDDLVGSRTAAGLGIFDLTGECADGLAGQAGAIGRRQCGPVLAAEIVAHDEFVAILRQHQIQTGSLVVAGKQQIGVGYDHDVRAVRGTTLGVNIDGMKIMRLRNRTQAIGQSRIEFIDVIQMTIAKG